VSAGPDADCRSLSGRSLRAAEGPRRDAWVFSERWRELVAASAAAAERQLAAVAKESVSHRLLRHARLALATLEDMRIQRNAAFVQRGDLFVNK
jgi:hypothetical protein